MLTLFFGYRVFTKKEYLENELPRIGSADTSGVLLLNELLPTSGYDPDFEAAKAGGTKLYIRCSRFGLKRNHCTFKQRGLWQKSAHAR